MTDVLEVTLRETRGTAEARRGRAAGNIPAVLYGHGKESICLDLPAEQIEAALRHGGHLVELSGALSESALIKDTQWDAFGMTLLHVDLTRVKKGEFVPVTLTVELKGDAPGSHEGGIVQHQLHEVEIQCPADAIPDRLELKINSLGVGDSLTAGDLDLPSDASLLTDPEAVIVQCTAVAAEEVPEEEVGAAAGSDEPEVIGRKAEEEGEAENAGSG